MASEQSCQLCEALAATHQKTLNEYLLLVDLQAILFNRGSIEAAKELDVKIQAARRARRRAGDALAIHYDRHHGVNPNAVMRFCSDIKG